MRRPAYLWKLRSRQLELGARTLIMGVLNVTPDSFYDGGRYLDRSAAVEHAARLLEEGADFIDVGGESTRPGARVSSDASGDREIAAVEPEPPGCVREAANARCSMGASTSTLWI